MATPKEAIEPGSLEQGTRGPTEDLLAGLGGGATAAGPAGPGGAVPPAGADPLGALMGGGVVPPGGDVLTDGLDVGPGFSPAAARAALPDDVTQRLRLISEMASTPHLRFLAKEMLRRRVRMNKRADANFS
jgi:hypothetical protein